MYVTDALKAIADNTAKTVHSGGTGLKMRYLDMMEQLERKKEVPQKDESQTASDIIERMKGKMKNLVGG